MTKSDQPIVNDAVASPKGGVLGWRITVLLLAITSGFVTLWNLANGERSEYYAAIAMSMSKSFSNFFFGAIDPAGTITLDKIPGSYWLSAIFVKLFGFSTWAVNAPNALATVGIVLVIALSIKNLYSARAGLIAGLLVAGVPVAIAVARSNQPESMFVLMLSLALWQAIKAFKLTSRKHLIFAGAWIAAAFQMYMIVAWAIWPALIIAWFFTEQKLLKKIFDLALAGSISLVLSLVWIFITWLTPTSNRPYIGSTYFNNPWEMVFGYNALGRFSNDVGSAANKAYRSFTPPFGGSAGVDRLFNYQISGQVSWLIPATVIAIVTLLVLRKKLTTTLFLASWFVVFAIMFSAVAGLHQFYVTAMVIPMVALIAMAVEEARREGKFIWIAIMVGVTAMWALAVGAIYSGYLSAFPYLQLGIATLTLIGIFAGYEFMHTPASKGLLTAGIVGSLVLTPAAWSVDAMNHPSKINPVSGPTELQMSMGRGQAGGPGVPMGGAMGGAMGGGQRPAGGSQMQRPSGMFGNEQVNAELLDYLNKNRGNAKYLVATYGAQNAAPIINQTGDNVLPLGGFSETDAAPTLEQFKALVASGDVKYVLNGMSGMGGGPNSSQSNSSDTEVSKIRAWVTENFVEAADYTGSDNLLVYSK